MNPIEIEEAISRLAEQSFDPSEFPYAFLEAFGNKATTINRLRKPRPQVIAELGNLIFPNPEAKRWESA